MPQIRFHYSRKERILCEYQFVLEFRLHTLSHPRVLEMEWANATWWKSVSYPDPVFMWAGWGLVQTSDLSGCTIKGSGVKTRWDLGMRLYARPRSGIVLSVHVIMNTTAQLGVCIHSVCLTCISMTFEPTGDTCVTCRLLTHVLVGVACTFGMISYVQQSVRKMAERTMKEFQEVSKVWTTSLSMRIWSFLETAILCFASHCSLIFIDHIAEFMR